MSATKSSSAAAAAIALAGVWALRNTAAEKLKSAIAAFDWNAPADDTKFDQRETKTADGVAVIPVIGAITKYAAFYDRYFGFVSSSWIGAEIDKAEADPLVKRIVLLFDSPGGMVDGTGQLGNRIGRCAKPIDAVISDCCCSAALWLACQCDTITANAGADVGSIGVVMIGIDDSEFWKALGITFRVVSSGGIKGEGHDGRISDPLAAEWQRSVDDGYALFITAVASGRGMTEDAVRKLADGRSWRAAEAMQLKLIDRVADADVAIGAIRTKSTKAAGKTAAAVAPRAENALHALASAAGRDARTLAPSRAATNAGEP